MSTVVLISGNGSNLQAMIDAQIPISAVISNQADAFGLTRAASANIPTHVLEHQKFASRELFDNALQTQIEKYNPKLVVMAGFMRILSDPFVRHFYGKLINIHPSLLPKYKGLHTHKRVLENGDTQHGVTIHYVNNELDGGPIITQAQLMVGQEEEETRLATRIHSLEHKLYPYTIALILEGRISLAQDRVMFDGSPLAKSGIMLNL